MKFNRGDRVRVKGVDEVLNYQNSSFAVAGFALLSNNARVPEAWLEKAPESPFEWKGLSGGLTPLSIEVRETFVTFRAGPTALCYELSNGAERERLGALIDALTTARDRMVA